MTSSAIRLLVRIASIASEGAETPGIPRSGNVDSIIDMSPMFERPDSLGRIDAVDVYQDGRMRETIAVTTATAKMFSRTSRRRLMSTRR
jgi:hypothetical protein